MKITRNYDGIPEQTDYPTMPDGEYMFEIQEKKDTYSEAGDVMIKIILRCMEEGEHEGIKVRDNIMIPEPESPIHKIIGRTKRFLHAIGEPYQGTSFEVDTDNWVNKTVMAKIKLVEYRGNPKNEVDRYLLLEGDKAGKPKSSNEKTKPPEDDLPF